MAFAGKELGRARFHSARSFSAHANFDHYTLYFPPLEPVPATATKHGIQDIIYLLGVLLLAFVVNRVKINIPLLN